MVHASVKITLFNIKGSAKKCVIGLKKVDESRLFATNVKTSGYFSRQMAFI